VGLLGSAAAGLFPRLLPSEYGSPIGGLDIYNAASPATSLRLALAIYVIGMAIVIVYLVKVYRIWGGRVTTEHTYRL
jgi:cytochrome bd-type quinol oxidase subunit 2